MAVNIGAILSQMRTSFTEICRLYDRTIYIYIYLLIIIITIIIITTIIITITIILYIYVCMYCIYIYIYHIARLPVDLWVCSPRVKSAPGTHPLVPIVFLGAHCNTPGRPPEKIPKLWISENWPWQWRTLPHFTIEMMVVFVLNTEFSLFPIRIL